MIDPHATITIGSAREIEAIANPLRARIVRHASRPVTVAELADRFDVPVTRLYYHVDRLLDAGILAQVEERKSGARIERVFLRTGGDFQVGPGLAEEVGDPRRAAELAAALLVEPTRVEIEAGLARILVGEDLEGDVSRSVVHLPPDAIRRFRARVSELAADLVAASDTDDPDAIPYGFTTTFLPVDGS